MDKGCREGKLKEGRETHGREREREKLWSGGEAYEDEEESEGNREGEERKKRIKFPLQRALLAAGKLFSLNQGSADVTSQFKSFHGSRLLANKAPSPPKCPEL